MATKTTNYNLIKPDLTDDADIRVINGNMDVLDTQLKTVADSVTSGNKNAYTDVSVSNDYTWKFTKGSGANVSYDTIKNATVSKMVGSSNDTYKVPTDSSKRSKLEYWFGTMPYKGSDTATTDSGVLKFNHWGTSAWNSAFVANNTSTKRPYMMYQNGTAGEYSVFKEFAWKDDVDTKLDKSGGNVTGNIYTTSSIFKNSNNGVLQLGGSTDGSHGARINLSGENESGKGFVQLTADNGTTSNVMQVYPNNGQYSFNGVGAFFNSQTDVVYIGNSNTPKLALNKSGTLLVAQANSSDFHRVLTRNLYTGDWDGVWAYQWNDLLIQGGRFQTGDYMTNITLPRPYKSKESYILYVSDNTSTDGLSNWAVAGKKISNTTIAVQYFLNKYVTWLTIGGWSE